MIEMKGQSFKSMAFGPKFKTINVSCEHACSYMYILDKSQARKLNKNNLNKTLILNTWE